MSEEQEENDPETGVVIGKVTTALALPKRTSEIELRKQARYIIRSGYLPPTVFREEQVLTLARAGEELGLAPMSSLRSLSPVDGKISIDAQAMRALVFKKMKGARLDFIEVSEERCVIEAQRPGGRINRFEYTIEMAKKAGLLTKRSWQKFPISMLINRCSSIACKAIFPDLLVGWDVSLNEDQYDEALTENDIDFEVKKIQTEILALATALPEEKKTICIDQTERAFRECNITLLSKILTRVREIVHGREDPEEIREAVIVHEDKQTSEGKNNG